MRKIITFFISALLMVSLEAKIVETAHFSELKNYITKESLIILDIDDTLLIPVQMLGCDEWFTGRLKKFEQEGLSRPCALDKALAEWEAIRHLTKMEIVEPETDSIVRSIQEAGYTVMGLTTQGLALATRTSRQLQDLGIILPRSCLHKNDECVSVYGHTVLYRDGILFTSGTAKGEALFLFLQKIGYSPKRVVFVNDKASHLQDVETSCVKQNVEFIGLRYAYSDARKRAYDPKVAEVQFTRSSFLHILTDAEAKIIMERQ
jgi:hypothetical protein